MPRRKLSFTDPATGEVHTRNTEAGYTHISIDSSGARWHTGYPKNAGNRRVYRLDKEEGPGASNSYSTEHIQGSKACTVPGCGRPAVQTLRTRNGTFHECNIHAQ